MPVISTGLSEALDAMDLDPASRADLLLFRATSATGLKLHDRAVGWYRAAIAAEQGERSDTARFNLACELAKTGQHEAALPMLEEAISLRSSFADDARTDDYFEAMWDTVPFIRVVARWDEPPTVEAVEQSLQRALGLSYRGEGEDALAEGHRAVAGAAALGDDALLARALGRLGGIHTYETSAARGVAMLERAEEIGRKALADDPRELVAVLHALGAALHAAERFDDAEERYREAMELRKSALGPEHETVAISLGDLARLASSRGRLDEAEELMTHTVALLEKVVARTEGQDQWDALVNLALVQGNRAAGAAAREAPFGDVLRAAEEAADRIDAVVRAGARVPSGALPRLRKAVAGSIPRELSPDLSERLGQLSGRLLALEEPDPAVRAERLYWAGLKQGARELIAAGATDVEIAHAIRRAVRGEPQGAPTEAHPAFSNLNVEIASRLSAPTNLIMVAMALDLAIGGHQSIVDVLGELEGFAVANAQGAGGDVDDDGELEDDEDDLGDLDEDDD